MKEVPDNILIKQLRSGDNASFEILYGLYFRVVSSFIKRNMGNAQDAEDIFQETITVLLKKVRQSDFELTSSLKTYLFSIAKHLWLKRLRDNKLIYIDNFETYPLPYESFAIELIPEKTRTEKVSHWITKITRHCQYILKAIFFHNEPMENLMKKMGWKNKHTAANQQYKCIQQIRKVKEKEA